MGNVFGQQRQGHTEPSRSKVININNESSSAANNNDGDNDDTSCSLRSTKGNKWKALIGTNLTLKLIKQPLHITKNSKNGKMDIRFQPFAGKQASTFRSRFSKKVGALNCEFWPINNVNWPRLRSCNKESKGRPNNSKVQNSSRLIVRASEMNEFFKLTEDPVVDEFLKTDSCKLIADKYLLSMVFAYFKRASFSLREYDQLNFFVGLYLANDVEEDEEDLKYEILPWALGQSWGDGHKDFLKLRDLLFRRMDYKAIISRRCCDEIMAIEPDHKLWKRCRPIHHGGAIRSHMRDSNYGTIYGPDTSPPLCPNCDTTEDLSKSNNSPRSSIYIATPQSQVNKSSLGQ